MTLKDILEISNFYMYTLESRDFVPIFRGAKDQIYNNVSCYLDASVKSIKPGYTFDCYNELRIVLDYSTYIGVVSNR